MPRRQKSVAAQPGRRSQKQRAPKKQSKERPVEETRGFRRGGKTGQRRGSAAGTGPRHYQPDAEAVLEALVDSGAPQSASALAALMKLPPETARGVARVLRELALAHEVVETRPGRFAVSGHEGEFPAILEQGPDGLIARLDEERTLPLHPRHSLGAGAQDRVVVMAVKGQAMVVRVDERAGRELPGSLDFSGEEMLFVPDNRREGRLRVLNRRAEILDLYRAGDRVVATLEVQAWGESMVTVSRRLDDSSPEVADFELVRLVHDLPGPFPPEVETAAEHVDAAMPVGARLDLRKELIFTIDPASAKDFDDAISIRREGGGWVVGVHIADVSHFVRHGGVIDQEAARRGTSCYLVNRVIPMLPECLSNGLCSLVPNEDRYALSLHLHLDAQLKVQEVVPAESLIRSRHRLTYEQALAIIEGRHEGEDWPADLCTALGECHRMAQSLRRQREQLGALNLFSVEHAFSLDAEGNPIEVTQETSDVAHQLIEEFMLLANRCVAAWLVGRGAPCTFRVHGEPDAERLAFFAQALDSYGMPNAPVQDRNGLRTVLQRLAREPRGARIVLNHLMLRSFQKAYYSVENIGHYALAFEHYAHFTSPIRRYPDLIVHRLVKSQLGLEGYADVEREREVLDALARQSSFLERRAEGAERDLHRTKAARYLARRLGDVFPAVVLHPSPMGLGVQLLETGLEGLVPLRELGNDFYEFDGERLALVGRGTGALLTIGLECEVQVIHVDITRAEVTLTLASGMPRPARRDRPAASDSHRDFDW